MDGAEEFDVGWFTDAVSVAFGPAVGAEPAGGARAGQQRGKLAWAEPVPVIDVRPGGGGGSYSRLSEVRKWQEQWQLLRKREQLAATGRAP
jgi:hypothetical protein